MAYLGLSVSMMLSLILTSLLFPCNHCDIIDTGDISINAIKILRNHIKIPKGFVCKHSHMMNAQIIHPDERLVKDIQKLGIPLNSARTIAYALQHGGRVFLTDKKAYKLAKYLKLEAVYVPNKK
jgi:hypothetical protein